MLRKTGLSSNVLYTMGLVSIGASVAAWAMSRNMEASGIERADRWGIFVGLWAPTILTMGCAMRMEEQARAIAPRRQSENSMHRPSDRSDRSRAGMPLGT